jgi:hypothetical protein
MVLLSVLSWSSFLLEASAVDVRLGTVMTILLAFVAFQFIVNDALPATGGATRLHNFITLSNVLIVLSGLESLLVYLLETHGIRSFSALLHRCMGSRKNDKNEVHVHMQAKTDGMDDGMDGPSLSNGSVVPAGPLECTLDGSDTRNTEAESDKEEPGIGDSIGESIGGFLAHLHFLDRVCLAVFPALYAIATGLLLRPV